MLLLHKFITFTYLYKSLGTVKK